MEKDCRLINLDIIKTEKPGVLVPINDIKKELDMDVKRVFYIYGFTENIQSNNRGYHAHENTKQVLINIRGSVNIKVRKAKSKIENTFVLDEPNKVLIVPPFNFIKMENFTPESIFLVLCDNVFSEDIYIYDKTS